MKNIIFVLLLIFCFLTPSSAQNFKYAWIVSPAIGSAGADTVLTSIVRDINLNGDLKFVIVSGNLTARGNINELDSLKAILDSLRVRYYVVPGENDLRWSPDAGLKFNSLFREGHFSFGIDSTKFIGLNCSMIWRGGGGHFSPGEIKWLSNSLKSTNPDEEIFLFANYPLNEKLDNWFKAANLLTNHKFSVLFTADQNPKSIAKISGVTTVAGIPASAKGTWNYNVIGNKEDSLLIYTVKNGVTGYRDAVLKEKAEINNTSPEQFFDFSGIVDKSIPVLKSNILWQTDLNITSLTNLCTTENKIISTSYNGLITCFDLSGKILWKYDSREKIISTPVSDGNILIVATLQGDLISLDINTGSVSQIVGIGEPLTSGLIKTDLVYNGSPTTGVIVATEGGKLYCYDIYSFELIWENDSAHDLVKTKPLIINHRLFYGSRDGFLYCVDDRTGALIWKWTNGSDFYSSPAACQPVSDGQYIYIVTPDKNLYKIDMLLGVTKWKKDYNAWESLNISSDNKYLIVKSISNKIYFVYAKDGRKYKELNLAYGFDLNPGKPIEWKENFLLGSEKGKVYLIDKNLKWEPLFFAGNARLNFVQHINDNVFAVSNIDGKIICFEIK